MSKKKEDAFEKMHSGRLYDPADKTVLEEQVKAQQLLYEYNLTRPGEGGKRASLLREMCAEIGDNSYIEPPLRANWGCKHVHFGSNIFINFNLTLVDDTHIYIGDNVMIAPNVTIATAGHPVHPELRLKWLQYNLPVRIEKNCWLGAGVTVLPGVTVGEGSVIGAGSVVTRDIPANVVAVGNPCRVVREIGERDRKYYHGNLRIEEE